MPALPCWNAESLSCGSKRKFLAVRSGYTFAKRKLARFTKDQQQDIAKKAGEKRRPTVPHYLNELPD